MSYSINKGSHKKNKLIAPNKRSRKIDTSDSVYTRDSTQEGEYSNKDVCCPQPGMRCVTTGCAYSVGRSGVEPVSEGCWGGSEARGQSCVASCLAADSICPQRQASLSCVSVSTTGLKCSSISCLSLWRSWGAHPVTLSVLFDPINNHLIPIPPEKKCLAKISSLLMAESWLFLKPAFLSVSNDASGLAQLPNGLRS